MEEVKENLALVVTSDQWFVWNSWFLKYALLQGQFGEVGLVGVAAAAAAALQIYIVFNCVPLSTGISLYGLHLIAIYSPM